MGVGSIDVVDIERDIEGRFVTGLRAIFEMDSSFVYNEDDTKTKIMITPEYPEKGSSFYTPHLVVTNISYQFNRQNSFFKNYHQDIINDDGIYIGTKSANIVPYSLNVICLAEYFVSKDLANKTVNYISYAASEVFDIMGLNIQNVSKSPTAAQQQWAEHIFDTNVTVNGYVQWAGRKTTDVEALNIMKKIKQRLEIKFKL